MALPVSGPLSIDMIRNELGTSNGSLRALSAQAGFSTPDAISEFYGYAPPPSCGPITVGFDVSSAISACTNYSIGVTITVYSSPASLSTSNTLYRTACGGTLGRVGFYSNGVIVRYWNGTAFTSQSNCIQ